MLSGLFTLIGAGFFIKLFFMTAEKIKNSGDNNNAIDKKKYTMIHIAMGIIFIVVGRLVI